MSRRTKLIIAALFLVLLAIPAIYIAVTWTPGKPPRFRVIRMDPAPADPLKDPGHLVLEVENQSFIPIEVTSWVVLMAPEDVEHIIRHSKTKRVEYEKLLSSVFAPGMMTLRGYDRTRQVQMYMNTPPRYLTRQGVCVEYRWRTLTRKWWAEVDTRLPVRVQVWLRRFTFDEGFSRGVATLEVPDSLVDPSAASPP